MSKHTIPVRLVFEGEVTIHEAKSKADAEKRVRENWGAVLGEISATENGIEWDISMHPEKQVGSKIEQTPEFLNRVIDWFAGDDHGVSSETIMNVMLGRKMNQKHGPDIPYDPADLGRCLRLLEKFPEFNDRLGEMSKKYTSWKPFVENFDHLKNLYHRDVKSGKSNELYRFMRGLRDGVDPIGFKMFDINPGYKDGVTEYHFSSLGKKDMNAIANLAESHPGNLGDKNHGFLAKGLFLGIVDKEYKPDIEKIPGVMIEKPSGAKLAGKIMFVAPYPSTFTIDDVRVTIANQFNAGLELTKSPGVKKTLDDSGPSM